MRWKTSWNLESLNFTSYFIALKLCDPQARSGKNGLNFKKSQLPGIRLVRFEIDIFSI